jgi:hypothetical protein
MLLLFLINVLMSDESTHITSLQLLLLSIHKKVMSGDLCRLVVLRYDPLATRIKKHQISDDVC